MSTNIHWQTAYQSAVLETDNSRLAEKAIFTRLRTMPIEDQEERLAIQKALKALEILRRERLGKPA